VFFIGAAVASSVAYRRRAEAGTLDSADDTQLSKV
jgi:hypothetical protein